ncbi:DUF3310 domain-containing protein [Uniformispora flossi]|uniref:DUF3310 domain-containing protein n=1 Tax=Uniformispora flossi TaxID=3390723 RepID=UPI003C2FBC7A
MSDDKPTCGEPSDHYAGFTAESRHCDCLCPKCTSDDGEQCLCAWCNDVGHDHGARNETALNARLTAGIEQVRRGETHDLGSFTERLAPCEKRNHPGFECNDDCPDDEESPGMGMARCFATYTFMSGTVVGCGLGPDHEGRHKGTDGVTRDYEWDVFDAYEARNNKLDWRRRVIRPAVDEDGEAGEPNEALREAAQRRRSVVADAVNHPSHYNQHPVECIVIAETMSFCQGNALKYLWRAGSKGPEIEDLKKAAWYVQREIDRLEQARSADS